MSDDFDFKIKRKKLIIDKDSKDKTPFDEKNKIEKKPKSLRRDKKEKKKLSKTNFPKYKTDKVIANILGEAINNQKYFKPLQMILTEGKKDLVQSIKST